MEERLPSQVGKEGFVVEVVVVGAGGGGGCPAPGVGAGVGVETGRLDSWASI